MMRCQTLPLSSGAADSIGDLLFVAEKKKPRSSGLSLYVCRLLECRLPEIVKVEPEWLTVLIVSDRQLGRRFRWSRAVLLALGFPLRLLRLFFLAGALLLTFAEAGS